MGRVLVRSAYGVRLTVPCEGDPAGCTEVLPYEQVLRLDFALETRRAGDDGIGRADEPLGTLLLAMSFSTADAETFREELEAALGRLAADAFSQPLAGMADRRPFEASAIAPRSETSPAWLCRVAGGATRDAQRFHRMTRTLPDGSTEVVGHGSRGYGARPPTPVCDEMDAATSHLEPQVVETIPVPRRLLEIAVLHDDAVRIDGEQTERRAALPDGATVVQRRIPEGITGSASGGIEDAVYAQYGQNGWRFEAWARPGALPLDALDHSAWLHRFRIETVERQLGVAPSVRVVGDESLLVVHLATPPPILREEIGDDVTFSTTEGSDPPATGGSRSTGGPAEIDPRAFLDGLAARLDRAEGPLLDAVERFARWPDAGLVSPGWISVACGTEGPPEYALLPTAASHRVTNGELFCAAAESRLPP